MALRCHDQRLDPVGPPVVEDAAPDNTLASVTERIWYRGAAEARGAVINGMIEVTATIATQDATRSEREEPFLALESLSAQA